MGTFKVVDSAFNWCANKMAIIGGATLLFFVTKLYDLDWFDIIINGIWQGLK